MQRGWEGEAGCLLQHSLTLCHRPRQAPLHAAFCEASVSTSIGDALLASPLVSGWS